MNYATKQPMYFTSALSNTYCINWFLVRDLALDIFMEELTKLDIPDVRQSVGPLKVNMNK